MAATAYFLSNTAEGTLTGGTVNKQISETPAAATYAPTVGGSATNTVAGFTPSGIPGASGSSTGVFYVIFDVTTGSTNFRYNTIVRRVNSSGVVQASATGTETSVGTAGTYTWKFSSPALGTWAAGDRLRVDYNTRNTGTMNTAAGIALGAFGKSWVSTPWNPNISPNPEALGGSNWSLTNATATANSTTAPDGNSTADSLLETVTSGGHFFRSDTTTPYVPPDDWVFSVYLKGIGRTQAFVRMNSTVSSGGLVNLSDNTVTTDDSVYTNGIVSAPQGFSRAYCFGAVGAAGFLQLDVAIGSGGSISYAGDITKGLYVWGMVLEPGLTPSAYPGVPTATYPSYYRMLLQPFVPLLLR